MALLLLACSGRNALAPGRLDAAAGTTGAAGADAAPGADAAAGTSAGLCVPSVAPSTNGKWTNRTPTPLPAYWPKARQDTAMVFDAKKGKTVMYGGYMRNAPARDTWEWDGADGTWLLFEVVEQPVVFDMIAATYDSARGRMFLFGGEAFLTGGPTNDIWEWGGDDQSWLLVAPFNPQQGPSKQTNAVVAYDPLRSRMITYGVGWDEAAAKTYGWDPATQTWIDLQTKDGPMNLAGGAFVWDPCRDRGVFFGGTAMDELWEWDPVTSVWTQRTKTPGASWPIPRVGAGLVFDTKVGRPLMFGGTTTNYSQYYDDLWQWDGQTGTWTDLGTRPSLRPVARAPGGIAFDSARGALVVFSGAIPGGDEVPDLWEWERQ